MVCILLSRIALSSSVGFIPNLSFVISSLSCAERLVGLTGLEPVTLRLSSACSNQLSYRPKSAPSTNDSERQRRQLPLTLVVVHWCSLAFALATGGKGTRTPDL